MIILLLASSLFSISITDSQVLILALFLLLYAYMTSRSDCLKKNACIYIHICSCWNLFVFFSLVVSLLVFFSCIRRMGDNKVLRFFWRASVIEVKVDIDKCNIMDVVIDYEDEAKKRGVKLDYAFPTFRYAYKMEH